MSTKKDGDTERLIKAAMAAETIVSNVIKGAKATKITPPSPEAAERMLKAAQKTILNWDNLKFAGGKLKDFAGDNIVPAAKAAAPLAKDAAKGIANIFLKR